MSQAGEINTAAGPVPPFVATEYLTNDGNDAVPLDNILKVYGNQTASPANNGFQSYTTSSGNTVYVNSYGVAKWIVNPVAGLGTHQTISAAIASASSGDIILITQGTYTENPTVTPGLTLVGLGGATNTPQVKIVGTVTMTGAGTVNISGIELQTNGSYCLSITGSALSIFRVQNCYINAANATGIQNASTNGNSIIYLDSCYGLAGDAIKYFDMTGAGGIVLFNCKMDGGGSSISVVSGTSSGAFQCHNTTFDTHSFAMSNSASVLFFNSTVNNLTFSNTSSGTIRLGEFGTVTVNAGTTCEIENASTASNATNVITGAGTVEYNGIAFTGSSANINATTQIVRQFSNTIPRTATSASTYTVLSTDYFISVDCSGGAKQVNLPNAPSTNQIFIIKDRTGSAATNNITVTTPGGIVDIDGATTYVIANDYGSITVCFNGTSYEVI